MSLSGYDNAIFNIIQSRLNVNLKLLSAVAGRPSCKEFTRPYARCACTSCGSKIVIIFAAPQIIVSPRRGERFDDRLRCRLIRASYINQPASLTFLHTRLANFQNALLPYTVHPIEPIRRLRQSRLLANNELAFYMINRRLFAKSVIFSRTNADWSPSDDRAKIPP